MWLAHYAARRRRGAVDTQNFLSKKGALYPSFGGYNCFPVVLHLPCRGPAGLEEQTLTCLPPDLLLSHPRRISPGHCSPRPAQLAQARCWGCPRKDQRSSSEFSVLCAQPCHTQGFHCLRGQKEVSSVISGVWKANQVQVYILSLAHYRGWGKSPPLSEPHCWDL